MSELVVLGSLNLDFVVRAQRAPAAGETLLAEEFHTIPGGKGANQAMAAARLGISTALIGRVGQDDFAEKLLDSLIHQSVDTSFVRRDLAAQTGLALIVIDKMGENRILLLAGANAHISSEDIDKAADQIRQAKLFVCHFETPLPALIHAIDTASQYGIPFLLNPAPAFPIPDHLLKKISYLILNETEAQAISGLPVRDISMAEAAGRALIDRGTGAVILTLGSQGAMLATQEGATHVPGFAIQPVDTTAAGDAFIGGFAAASIRRLPLVDRVRYANACGALAATRLGAQTSLPTQDEVDKFLAVAVSYS